MLLMIDNYDSFTYNLVQYFCELDQEVVVHRNDEIDIATIRSLNPSVIVLSPGPGTPQKAGVTLDVIQTFAGKIPMFGVCLGHQAMVEAFGGKTIHANAVMHGKTSGIHHSSKGVFNQLPSPFTATRYHSLVTDANALPDCFETTAWTQTDSGEVDEIMGVKHKDYLLEGVQFHPESILTEHGHDLLRNFLNEAL